MSTLVGKQNDFKKALQELLELDYDAIEAYEAAINRIEDSVFKSKLNDFKMDHQNHVVAISSLLRSRNEEVPTGPDSKQWLTKGKVVLAGLLGDKAILAAMLTNEEDTNTAYERMASRPDVWEEAKVILQNGLQDEKRHKTWIESVIKKTTH
jgi:rubrerythrin